MNLFPSFVIDKRRYYAQKSTHLFFVLSNKSKNSKLRNYNIQMLLIGLCLGLTLGIAFVPLYDIDCYMNTENNVIEPEQVPSLSNSISGAAEKDNIHRKGINTVENQINVNKKEQKPQGSESDSLENRSDNKIQNPPSRYYENIRRPRFFSTELGLRKKLIAGVILSEKCPDTVDSICVERLVAINKTLSNEVNKLVFFVVGQNLGKKVKALGIPGVVVLSDGVSSVSVPSSQIPPLADDHSQSLNTPMYNKAALKALKYLGDKVVEGFDYTFLTLDLFYINGHRLMESVNRISISQDVFWGKPHHETCKLENGFVLSRRLVQKLSSRVDRCLSSSLLNISGNFTKCVHYLANLTCVNVVEGEIYSTVNVPLTSSPGLIKNAISIGPVSSQDEIMKIHEQITRNRKAEINKEIDILMAKISWLAPKTSNPSEFETWPIGIPKPFVPRNRFNILKWKFFTSTAMYPENEYETVTSLEGNIDELDTRNVIASASQYLQARLAGTNVNATKIRFHHGYRRFEPIRGGEYFLDFVSEMGDDIYRIQAIRPLNKIEVVPIPYVTENRRITIVVPIISYNLNEIHYFLDRYFDLSTQRKANTVIILAIIIQKSYSSITPDQVENIKQLINQYNENLHKKGVSSTPASENVRASYLNVNIKNSKSQNFPMAVLDTLTRRLISPNSIILVLTTSSQVKDEFLNRVRMNTIYNWQVFSPVPFVEFNPRFSQNEEAHGKEKDVQKTTGYFDSELFSYLSFYAADYLNVRKDSNSTVITEAEEIQDFSAILYLYLRGSQLHILRAPDPGLKLLHKDILNGCTDFEQCSIIRWGSKAQLGKLILSSKLVQS